jgi:DNA-directed RNA polymerase specialized sigma24 family protein
MANYIDNKQFYNILVEYREKCSEAKMKDKPQPVIPNDIGNAFMMIATRLSNKSNFVGYTFKDEMVGDALENCVVAVNSFDPEKSKNPFAYFTQIVWYAFLRRIEKEKKQLYIKHKSYERSVIDNDLFAFDDESQSFDISNMDVFNEKMVPIIERYEKKTKRNEKKGLDRFLDEVEDEDSADY